VRPLRRFGNILDHGLDLIHPPLWYIAWGLGLEKFQPGIPGLSLCIVIWSIVLGYIGGRLVEGAFQRWLGNFGIFCWRPIDSYFRLITARRNPNLILLTIGVDGVDHPFSCYEAESSLRRTDRLRSPGFLVFRG